MAKLIVRVVGVKEAEAAIRKKTRALTHLRPMMAHIGEELLDSTRKRFVTMTAPDGVAWAPLDPNYRRRKKRNANKILTLSGNLSRLMRYQATDSKVEIGSDRVYAGTHQFGIGVKARPFLGLSDQDKLNVLDIVREHLE